MFPLGILGAEHAEALLGDVRLYLALLTADAAPAGDLAVGMFENAFWSWWWFDAAARIRADMAGRERPALRSDLGRAAS